MSEDVIDFPAHAKRILEDASRTRGGEVARVRSLFTNGLAPLRLFLAGAYPGRVSLNGVFCHGNPIVDFTHPDAPQTPSGCELGDLLIVVNHVFGDGSQTGRSLLLQAKLPHGDVPTRQALLYRDWPAFSYRRDASVVRHIQGGAHEGAQFAYLFDDGRTVLTRLPTHDADSQEWEHQLALAVVEMVQSHLRGGRRFYPYAEIANDSTGWSPIVWDLLRTMFSSATYSGANRVLDRTQVEFFLEFAAFPELLAAGPDPEGARQLWNPNSQIHAAAADIQPPETFEDWEELEEPGVSVLLIELDQRIDR